jgi:hypothetical protein
MDGFNMTKPLAPVAPVTTDVPSAESALCCATASSIQPPGGVLRSWIGNRRVLAVAGLGVTGGGLALGWDWHPQSRSRMMKYLMLATSSLPVVLSGTFALAHGAGMAGGMMGHGMQGCMQMMQGMNGGGGQRPNQQWRRGEVQSRTTQQIIGGMSD